ncbi:hypothetical protein [Flavobacterium caeni]|uniref:Uncharacterized protein n=1 Tax=Flavobacterium caeni TaxID=490189 RepID=A0A1G5BRU2_9FLAO|nr:hypothetical protein [Flavobacterium caeni]SCX92764.1 hypothetical protein SAMN02927903_00455 [Flavobacterium caeni]
MTTKHLFACIAFLFTPLVIGQHMTLKDGNKIPATAEWEFICENYALTGVAFVQIGKAEKGGWLQITAAATDARFYIGGVVYVYLDDHTALVCTDKLLRQNKDGQMTAWYFFTDAEIARLKKSNIQSIRFNVRGTASSFSSQTGNFTAVNKKTYFSVGQHRPQEHETAAALYQLYQP